MSLSPKHRSKLSSWAYPAMGCLLFGIFIFCIRIPLFQSFYRGDLEIIVRAAAKLQSGQSLYSTSIAFSVQETAHTKPPLATLLFIPLIQSNRVFLYHAWDFLNFITLAALLLYFTKKLSINLSPAPILYLPLLGAVILVNYWCPEFGNGQNNLFTFFLILFAALSKSFGWGGFFLTIAVLLKPTNIFFLPWIYFTQPQRHKLFAVASLCGALLSLAYVFYGGPSKFILDHVEWWAALNRCTQANIGRINNYGIPALLEKKESLHTIERFFPWISLIFVGGLAHKFRKNVGFSLALACVFALAASPMLWAQNFVILLPLIFFFLKIYEREKSLGLPYYKRSGLGGLFLLILSTQTLYPKAFPKTLIQFAPVLASPIWASFGMLLLLHRKRNLIVLEPENSSINPRWT